MILKTRVGKEMPKEVKQQIDTVNKQMTDVEDALHQTKTKKRTGCIEFSLSGLMINYPVFSQCSGCRTIGS